MKLPFTLPFNKQEKKEYFLALLLKEEKVNAIVFEESKGKIRVLGNSEEYFSDSLETIALQDFLDVLDKVIAQAEESLPSNIQTHKTIFGVKETWVQDTKIKKEYLTKLKAVCDALELIPVGFLVTQEAIAHFLQEEEGAPVSAILVEVGKKDLEVCLLRAGKVLEIQHAPIKDSVVHTVDTILHHFNSYEVLPSRIILLESTHHKGLSQAFITHTWSKVLPFLHVPQITTLPKDFDAKAVIFGAAAQMGFEIVGDIIETSIGSHETSLQEQLVDHNKKNDVSKKSEEETIMEDKKQQNTLYNHETFGFVKNTDITTQEQTQDSFDAQSSKEIIDNQEEKPLRFQEKHQNIQETTLPITQDTNKKPSFLLQLQKIRILMLSFLQKIPLLHQLSTFFSSKTIPASIKGKTKLMIIPPLILSVFVLVVLLYIFGLKATIALTVKPNVIEQDTPITLSTDQTTDFATNTLTLETIEVAEDGKVSTSATGKKEVGEKAKGTITILSALEKEQTFTKGTIITSSNNLKFILNETIKVASSSGLDDLKTVKADVIADDIGKESNLPSGSKFTVGTFSSSEVTAKNDTAFSGGTKKEISVVSKEDIDDLTKELPENLQEKANSAMDKKITEDQELLPLPLITTITKKQFDKDAGEEATTVTLTGTVTYKGFTYKKSDMEAFVKAHLQKNMQDKTSSQEGIAYEIKALKQKDDDTITATIQMKGFFLPKLDTKKVSDEIAGKSFEEAKSILSQLPQVTNSAISLHPGLPFLPSLLPKLHDNITVTIEKDE